MMKIVLNEYDNGHVMKILREWTGLTQAQFGAAIGKSERTVQDYEAGKIRFSYALLQEVADQFGITLTAMKPEE